MFNVTLFLILSLISFFLSTSLHTGGYNYKKQVVSHIGRFRVHGEKNNASLVFFFLFSLFYGLFGTNIGHYFINFKANNGGFDHLKYVGIFLYIGSIFGILMSVIPLDIHRWKHLLAAFITFINMLLANIYMLIHSITDQKGRVAVSILSSSQILFSALYIYGYITRTIPAIFQKLAMLTATFSIYVGFLTL